MSETYDHLSVESKWQKYWSENDCFKTIIDPAKEKKYILDMFPYPSGEGLHVGHPVGYIATDVISRYMRMRGKNVLHPMGWDAFGLPAENYAIDKGVHPSETTTANIATFTRQINSLGLSYDWNYELNTASPAYYKWTQWLFLKFYEAGLAYRGEAPVNWCEHCQTVLAREQASGGFCERCNMPVVQKVLRQWFFKITKYVDKLLEGLKYLDWPDTIKVQQRNWIGKSEGINFREKIKDLNIEFEVYDSIPQTFLAQTFTVIAPEHPLVPKLVEGTVYEKPVMEFVDYIKKKKAASRFDVEKDLEGIFTGRYVDNPFGTGDFPLWIASYVLADYGTGIVNCSAHDERDFAFAKKYNIPLKVVLLPRDETRAKRVRDLEESYRDPDGIIQQPEEFEGMRWDKSRQLIIDYIEKKGYGKKAVNYKIRDWLVSRQRYWGVPIPIIHCSHCGEVPVPEDQLPVLLPDDVDFRPKGKAPLATSKSFQQVPCPKCGQSARREFDTLDTFVCSSWYSLRFTDPTNPDKPFGSEKISYWGPVDLYVGGAEHAVMHLLYARFVIKALREMGQLEFDEPFLKLRNQGLIGGFSFKKRFYVDSSFVVMQDSKAIHRETGQELDIIEVDGTTKYKEKRTVYVHMNLVEMRAERAFHQETGEELDVLVEKMSKSKKNVINPDEVIAEFGADTLRLYEMFLGPLEKAKLWTTEGVRGRKRLIDRIWRSLQPENLKTDTDDKVERLLNKTIKHTTEQIESITKPYSECERVQLNTAISAFDVLVSEFTQTGCTKAQAEKFLKILSPFAPHIAEELWESYGHRSSISQEPWPAYDATVLHEDTLTCVIEINGKKRAVIELNPEITKDELLALIRERNDIKKFLDGKEIRKFITTPKFSIANIVI